MQGASDHSIRIVFTLTSAGAAGAPPVGAVVVACSLGGVQRRTGTARRGAEPPQKRLSGRKTCFWSIITVGLRIGEVTKRRGVAKRWLIALRIRAAAEGSEGGQSRKSSSQWSDLAFIAV